MITTKIFQVNAFGMNMIVLHDETNECVIVDCGCYTENEKKILDDYISSKNLKPVLMINTHGHVDHLLGARHVVTKYGIPFKLHAADISLVASAKNHGLAFGFNVEEPPVVTEYLEEGKDVKFGNSTLKVFHVPGHSPGSVAFYSPKQEFVIVGDVLFRGSIGRTDLPGGSYDTLIKSIKDKLLTLPPDTVVISGHGQTTTIQEERLSNPFLDFDFNKKQA